MTEYQVQCAVALHLRTRARFDVFWTAVPMGENRDEVTGARIKKMGARRGTADIILVRAGHPYALELKTETGRMSKVQIEAMTLWIASGGTWRTARGLDEALDVLREWGMFR